MTPQQKWNAKNEEKCAAYKRKYYDNNREKCLARSKQWDQDNPLERDYRAHKSHAETRQIEFLFTLDEWIDWWGEDFALRGRGPKDLCMARLGDEGPYDIGNVAKSTNYDNERCLL